MGVVGSSNRGGAGPVLSAGADAAPARVGRAARACAEGLEARRLITGSITAGNGPAAELPALGVVPALGGELARLPSSEAAAFLPPQAFFARDGRPLSGRVKGKPLDVAKRFLADHAAEMGLAAGDLSGMRVTDRYADADAGVTHIYFRQRVNGLDVANAALSVHLTRDNEVIAAGGGFVAGAGAPASATRPTKPDKAKRAATTALKDLAGKVGVRVEGEPRVVKRTAHASRPTVLRAPWASGEDVPAKLQYVATEAGLKLAWNVVLRTADDKHWYDASVDAETGEVIRVQDAGERPDPTAADRRRLGLAALTAAAAGGPAVSLSVGGAPGLDTVAFPALAAQAPVSSTVYAGSATGFVQAAGDQFGYTIRLDAGQTFAAAVTPSAGLVGTLELWDPAGTVVAAGASRAAGQPGLLQAVPVAAAGTYTLVVGGASGSTGTYTVTVTLNAAAETEGYTGTSNNDRDTAQDLDPLLGGAGSPAPARATILGNPAGAAQRGIDRYAVTLAAGDTLTAAVKTADPYYIELSLYGPVDLGEVTVSNTTTPGRSVERLIADFVAPEAGQYYVAVNDARTFPTAYALHVARNATLDVERNDGVAAAQPLQSREVAGMRRVFGGLGTNDPGDYYAVALSAGATLTVATATPGDGPGEPGNAADPRLRVLDAAGAEVAADDNAAPDGRNARLAYAAPAAGTYYVVASAAGVGTGSYTLDVTGADAPAVPFRVTATTPASGTFFRDLSSGFVTVTFNDSVLTRSIQRGGLTVDGTPATQASPTYGSGLGDNTINFYVPPPTADGVHTFAVGGGRSGTSRARRSRRSPARSCSTARPRGWWRRRSPRATCGRPRREQRQSGSASRCGRGRSRRPTSPCGAPAGARPTP